MADTKELTQEEIKERAKKERAKKAKAQEKRAKNIKAVNEKARANDKELDALRTKQDRMMATDLVDLKGARSLAVKVRRHTDVRQDTTFRIPNNPEADEHILKVNQACDVAYQALAIAVRNLQRIADLDLVDVAECATPTSTTKNDFTDMMAKLRSDLS